MVLERLLALERQAASLANDIAFLRELVSYGTPKPPNQPDLPLPPATGFGPSPRKQQYPDTPNPDAKGPTQ